MCSQKQLEANRLNAQHSTGPKTDEGKHRSSQNSLKHGLCSPSLLPAESPDEYEQFCTQIIEDLHPQSLLEHMLGDRIASLLWRLRRIPGAEHHLFTLENAQPNSHPSHTLADSFLNHQDKSNPINRLQRYEAHLHRTLTSTLKELRSLQKQRESQSTTDNGQLTADKSHQLQNEPIFPPKLPPLPTPKPPTEPSRSNLTPYQASS